MKRILCVLLLAVQVSPAFAQEDKVDCKNPITQPDMNVCAANDAADADAEMNKVWKTARSTAAKKDKELKEVESEPGAEKALLAAQRGWIAYRDGNCDLAQFEARGGSMEPMLYELCVADMTKARTKELKEFIKGGEQ